MIEYKPQSVRKFYFLEYFYVLLRSIQNSPKSDKIFDNFLLLKQQYRLGESKYKKMDIDENASHNKMIRYKFTFDQVLSESIDYELVRAIDGNIVLTDLGKIALELYQNSGSEASNQFLLKLMEGRYMAFRYIIETCYRTNREKSGLLIFPIYSAHRLGIERSSIKKSGDLHYYFLQLKNRLEQDILKYLNKSINLDNKNNDLIFSLIDAKLIPSSPNDTFDPKLYNAILKRVRDFWLKFFLQDLYNYEYSLSSFDIWAYRGKQIGLIHITEFYPDPFFTGRIVYPLSIIRKNLKSDNFIPFYDYIDTKKLYVHLPSWENEKNKEEFVQSLHQAYVDVRQLARTYFVSLLNVRERVCYELKIPEYLFDDFLSKAYHERLKIRISLEVDKLPEETNAIYLRREPVMIDGKFRNVIAIDLA